MKKGITLLALVIFLIFVSMILGTVVFYGIENINTAEYRSFIDMFEMTDNNVNAYILEYEDLPTDGIVVSLQTTELSFRNSVKLNNDDVNTLYLVSIPKLQNSLLKLGYGNVEDGNVFVVAENSNNIYYLKGTKHKGNYIHSLNDILSNDR